MSIRRTWAVLACASVIATCTWLGGGCSSVTRLEPHDEEPCEAVECTQPPEPSACYLPTGTCEDDACAYTFDDGAACDDGDACTATDTCANGGCSGTPVGCEPRLSECIDPTTLRSYDAGSCGGDACNYASADETCPNGCADGQCNPVKPMISLGYSAYVRPLGHRKGPLLGLQPRRSAGVRSHGDHRRRRAPLERRRCRRRGRGHSDRRRVRSHVRIARDWRSPLLGRPGWHVRPPARYRRRRDASERR